MAGREDGGHPMVLDFNTSMAIKSMNRMSGSYSPTDKTARSSFSSVRENDDGLAQTFTRSKVSSYTLGTEEVFDESPSAELSQPSFQAPLTQPHSKLHSFLVPADSFRGWKQIPLKGRKASRSVEDLHKMAMQWSPSTTPAPEKKPSSHALGASPLEKLPTEILGSIIDLLVVELPPPELSRRNLDLMALLCSSRALHAATLNTLYRHITIPQSRIFRKFLNTIEQYPALASIVRRLDFSHFNPSTMFFSASERAQTQNLTATTLRQCLELTPYLQEFLAQEYVDDDLGPDVLRKLFFDMPQLRAVDFCGCSSMGFRRSFNALLEDQWPETLAISRLSFHKSLSILPAVFEKMLPRLHKITHLDLAGTRVTDEALESIPATARITHLNLAKCKELSTEVVVRFITSHPAVKDTLVFLSLSTDASSHLLLGKDDVDRLLPSLPTSLKSLSLKGARMNASHVELLAPLIDSLEELALGKGLELGDVQRLFYKDGEWTAHNLRYLDISDIETRIGSGSELLSSASAPLHVIEVEERGYERAAKIMQSIERVGWTVKEFGSRFWLVRLNEDGTTRDNGSRWWKMGAESWGMRKIPVASAEVGGMYGSFMFGRRL